MKKLNIILVSCLMIIGLSSNLSAQPGGKGGPPAHVKPGPPSHVKPGPPPHANPGKPGNKPPVHAPLDGGLLTILGAAGIGYYLLRRRRVEN